MTLLAGGGYDEKVISSIVIYRTWSDLEAQLIKGILEEYGIPVGLATDISHTPFPFTLNGLGETRILVPCEAEDEAQDILAGYQSQTGRIDA